MHSRTVSSSLFTMRSEKSSSAGALEVQTFSVLSFDLVLKRIDLKKDNQMNEEVLFSEIQNSSITLLFFSFSSVLFFSAGWVEKETYY